MPAPELDLSWITEPARPRAVTWEHAPRLVDGEYFDRFIAELADQEVQALQDGARRRLKAQRKREEFSEWMRGQRAVWAAEDAARRKATLAGVLARWAAQDRAEAEAAAFRAQIKRQHELAEVGRLMAAPPVPDSDKSVRHRTGKDDHLELGRFTPAPPARVPTFPVHARQAS